MSGLVVQKYGGSVLTGERAFKEAARHVAHAVEEGRRVVAVVSALAGVTDELLGQARRLSDPPAPEALDLLLATGELKSAALLSLALSASKVDAKALNPWQLGLHTDHSHGTAFIDRINPLLLRAKLVEHPAVIVPGFLGRGEDNRLTTLGRGGSDLTAVALADALHAEGCEFFKDVPGYFSADPKIVPSAAHRPRVSGEEALELSRFGCRFLQDRAIEWARKNHCRVRLRALGEDERATVLSDRPRPGRPGVLALTHCRAGDRFRERIPDALGPDPVLLSLVGRGLCKDKELESKLDSFLARQRIPFRLTDRAPARLTLVIQARDLFRAQHFLHDRFVLLKGENDASQYPVDS